MCHCIFFKYRNCRCVLRALVLPCKPDDHGTILYIDPTNAAECRMRLFGPHCHLTEQILPAPQHVCRYHAMHLRRQAHQPIAHMQEAHARGRRLWPPSPMPPPRTIVSFVHELGRDAARPVDEGMFFAASELRPLAKWPANYLEPLNWEPGQLMGGPGDEELWWGRQWQHTARTEKRKELQIEWARRQHHHSYPSYGFDETDVETDVDSQEEADACSRIYPDQVWPAGFAPEVRAAELSFRTAWDDYWNDNYPPDTWGGSRRNPAIYAYNGTDPEHNPVRPPSPSSSSPSDTDWAEALARADAKAAAAARAAAATLAERRAWRWVDGYRLWLARVGRLRVPPGEVRRSVSPTRVPEEERDGFRYDARADPLLALFRRQRRAAAARWGCWDAERDWWFDPESDAATESAGMDGGVEAVV